MIADLFQTLWCFFIKILNFIIEYLLDSILHALAWALGILPTVPILEEPLEWGTFGDAVGYFIPIPKMIAHFSMMLIVMISWYGVQYILRLVKQIQ